LKEPTQSVDKFGVIKFVRNLLRRPAYRMGPVDNSRIRTTNTRNAQFLSYLQESGFRRVNADSYERSLRRRRLMKRFFFWMLGAGGAWVIVESAKALTLY
jgi:hypothetical protein